MRWSLLLLTAAIGAASADAAPQRWRPVQTSDGSPYKLYIDIANLVREGPARLFMAKMVPAIPSDQPDAADIASVLVRVKIDCSANTIETRSASMVDQGGEVTDLEKDPPRLIKSGTDDMMMRKLVC